MRLRLSLVKLVASGLAVGFLCGFGPAPKRPDNSHAEMGFVQVKAKPFLMGSPEDERDRNSDEKLHKVQIVQDFEIQTTEVTQKQYYDVMGVNPSEFKKTQNCTDNFLVIQGKSICPNNPVENVSYNDIQSFLLKLSLNRTDGYSYRLPTEAEWEYAARASTSTAYLFGDYPNSFGDDYPHELVSYAWFNMNSNNQTHEVAQLKPNGFGLYDMEGNVWELVADWYSSDYSNAGRSSPDAPGSGRSRVIRGAGWYSDVIYLRSAIRFFGPPDAYSSDVGFRLVRQRGQN
jgi:formylglycine-generating enzyme required for sulfatase activity